MSKSQPTHKAPKKRYLKITEKMLEVVGYSNLPDPMQSKARMEANAARRIASMTAGRNASNARPDGDTWVNQRIAG